MPPLLYAPIAWTRPWKAASIGARPWRHQSTKESRRAMAAVRDR
jgi:hypothetical protein